MDRGSAFMSCHIILFLPHNLTFACKCTFGQRIMSFAAHAFVWGVVKKIEERNEKNNVRKEEKRRRRCRRRRCHTVRFRLIYSHCSHFWVKQTNHSLLFPLCIVGLDARWKHTFKQFQFTQIAPNTAKKGEKIDKQTNEMTIIFYFRIHYIIPRQTLNSEHTAKISFNSICSVSAIFLSVFSRIQFVSVWMCSDPSIFVQNGCESGQDSSLAGRSFFYLLTFFSYIVRLVHLSSKIAQTLIRHFNLKTIIPRRTASININWSYDKLFYHFNIYIAEMTLRLRAKPLNKPCTSHRYFDRIPTICIRNKYWIVVARRTRNLLSFFYIWQRTRSFCCCCCNIVSAVFIAI